MRSLSKALIAACFALAVFAIATDASAHRRLRRHTHTTQPAPAIPEPAGALAFAAGLFAVTAATRRRKAR